MSETETITETKRKRSERRRERTLRLTKAAHDLLGEGGLNGLTIEGVLAKAGLARRAFYECFDGKDDLVLAVFAQSIAEGESYYSDQAERAQGASAALESVISGLVANSFRDEPVGNANRNIAFSQEHLKLAAFHPKQLEAALTPLIDLLARIIEVGTEVGEFAHVESRQTAQFIYNLVSATVHARLLSMNGGPDQFGDPGDLAQDLWQFCGRSLKSNI